MEGIFSWMKSSDSFMMLQSQRYIVATLSIYFKKVDIIINMRAKAGFLIVCADDSL